MNPQVIFWIGGAALPLIGGLAVKPFAGRIRRGIKVPAISDNPTIETAWRTLIHHPDKSGQWVGHVERLILFGALCATEKEAVTAVAAWVAFKVAAKWEAWNHMGHIPDTVKHVEELRYATARRIWAAQGYAALVLGTSANLMLAIAGAALATHGQAWSATFPCLVLG